MIFLEEKEKNSKTLKGVVFGIVMALIVMVIFVFIFGGILNSSILHTDMFTLQIQNWSIITWICAILGIISGFYIGYGTFVFKDVK